jgi:hypothetical protein
VSWDELRTAVTTGGKSWVVYNNMVLDVSEVISGTTAFGMDKIFFYFYSIVYN